MEFADTFTVLIHEGEEGERRYWAEVPDLPWCATVADTLDDREATLREAMAIALQIRAEKGQLDRRKVRTWELPISVELKVATPA